MARLLVFFLFCFCCLLNGGVQAQTLICTLNNTKLVIGPEYYGVVAGVAKGITSEGPMCSNCTSSINQLDIKGNAAIGSCACVNAMPVYGLGVSGDAIFGTCTQNTTGAGNTAAVQINSADNTKPGVAIFSTAPGSSGANGGAMLALYQDAGTAVTSGTQVATLKMGGATNGAHSLIHSAAISTIATENWSGSAAGTDTVFNNIAPGTNVSAETFRVTGSGTIRLAQKTTSQLTAITGAQNGEFGYASDTNMPALRTGGTWYPMGGNGYLINSCTVTTAVNSCTFSSLPTIFNHLTLIIYGRLDNAANQATVGCQFNGDATSGHYTGSELYFISAANGDTGGSTAYAYCGWLPAASQSTGMAGSVQVTIPMYGGTTLFKTTSFFGGYAGSSTSTGMALTGNGAWLNTAAITSIKVLEASGAKNFVNGTKIFLYGVY